MNKQIDTLIDMANRIGDFFESQPDREQALAGLAQHVQKFWEPRMRKAMLAFLEATPEGRTETAALTPFTLQALQQHKASLVPLPRV